MLQSLAITLRRPSREQKRPKNLRGRKSMKLLRLGTCRWLRLGVTSRAALSS